MRTTCRIESVVRVELRAPWLPGGAGLISRFLKWCLDADVISERGGSVGPTLYVGVFHARHRRKIQRWLAANAGGKPRGRARRRSS